MHHFAQMLALGGQPSAPLLAFRSSAVSPTGTAISRPAGVAAGDVVIILLGQVTPGVTVSTPAPAFFTPDERVISASSVAVAWKVITGADLSAPAWSANQTIAAALAIAWTPTNPASAISLRSAVANPGAQSTLRLPGFIPSANSRGVFTAVIDRDGATSTEVVPQGFAMTASSMLDSGNFKGFVADPSIPYGGGDVVWTATDDGVNHFAEAGWLFEVA